jgi:hypothetical protein
VASLWLLAGSRPSALPVRTSLSQLGNPTVPPRHAPRPGVMITKEKFPIAVTGGFVRSGSAVSWLVRGSVRRAAMMPGVWSVMVA